MFVCSESSRGNYFSVAIPIYAENGICRVGYICFSRSCLTGNSVTLESKGPSWDV